MLCTLGAHHVNTARGWYCHDGIFQGFPRLNFFQKYPGDFDIFWHKVMHGISGSPFLGFGASLSKKYAFLSSTRIFYFKDAMRIIITDPTIHYHFLSCLFLVLRRLSVSLLHWDLAPPPPSRCSLDCRRSMLGAHADTTALEALAHQSSGPYPPAWEWVSLGEG